MDDFEYDTQGLVVTTNYEEMLKRQAELMRVTNYYSSSYSDDLVRLTQEYKLETVLKKIEREINMKTDKWIIVLNNWYNEQKNQIRNVFTFTRVKICENDDFLKEVKNLCSWFENSYEELKEKYKHESNVKTPFGNKDIYKIIQEESYSEETKISIKVLQLNYEEYLKTLSDTYENIKCLLDCCEQYNEVKDLLTAYGVLHIGGQLSTDPCSIVADFEKEAQKLVIESESCDDDSERTEE